MSTYRVPRRRPDCPGRLHSKEARRLHGCICPPTDHERDIWRDASRRRLPASPQRLFRTGDADETAVKFALDGRPPAWGSVADRLAAVTILTRRGATADEIATQLRINRRTVERYRARAREAA